MRSVTVLAHPLLETGGLPLPPLALAAIAVLAVLGVALVPRDTPAPPPAPLADAPLGPGGIAGRVLGVLVLAGAIVAGRVGRNDVTGNLAPALIVGVGWPLLVAASAAAGRIWDRLDPWDTLARAGGPLTADRDTAPGPAVWWALPAAAALVWYLAAYREALQPRSIATALAVYTVVTLSGCLVAGRRQWLRSGEIVGLLLRWIGLIPRRRLVAWQPPAGAAVVLGFVAGGLLFALLRYSRLLNPLVFAVPGVPVEWVGVAVLAAAGAALGWAGERAAGRRGAPGAAAAALVPVVAGVALAAALVRGQLILAARLLPSLASDPLGRGWDVFGTAGAAPSPLLLNPAVLEGVQGLLLVVAGVAAAVVARQRAALQIPERRRAQRAATSAATLVCVLVAAGVLAATAA